MPYNDNNKYYLGYCNDKITNKHPTTDGWIQVMNTLKLPLQEYDKSRILLGILNEHKEIVVKVGGNDSIRSEYEYARRLYRIKGFVKFICYFECNDDFTNYPQSSKTSICNGPGTKMKTIIMPYFPLGCVGFYNWTDIQQFRSCLKQAFLSHKNALDSGLLHGDFHAGNVLLKTTKQSQILYEIDDNEFVIETNGLRTWIMDFENTREIARDEPKDMIDYYYDIQKFIFGLQDHRFIQKIDRASVVPLLRIISQQNQMVYPDIQFTKKILHSIDNIVFRAA